MKHTANKIQLSEGGEKGREFYTVSQLAELLQLTEMTIYRMISRGELPCYVIGRAKRFRSSDLENFLASCRMPAAGEKKSKAEKDSTEPVPQARSQER
jgi:excisionase family DNA binding protein